MQADIRTCSSLCRPHVGGAIFTPDSRRSRRRRPRHTFLCADYRSQFLIKYLHVWFQAPIGECLELIRFW